MSDINDILSKQPILLIDGDCVLCNHSVNFLLAREKTPRLSFASLQSEAGKKLLAYFEIDNKVDSMVLIRNHQAFIKSCAALRISQYMKGLWPLLVVFVVIPPFLRNPIYDYIAKRRYKKYGKTNACAIVKPEYRQRFLEV